MIPIIFLLKWKCQAFQEECKKNHLINICIQSFSIIIHEIFSIPTITQENI